MKKVTFSLLVATILLVIVAPGRGQTLFEENFDYAVGDTLLGQGWQQIRNGNPITVVDEGLSYPGYLDDIGNAARLVSDGNQEIRHIFPAVSSDSLYLSYLIRIIEDTTSLAVYLYLGGSAADIFQRRMSAFIKKNESGKIAFGIQKGGSGGVSMTGYHYDLDTTYLILMKYSYKEGDNNDVVSLWVNPPLNGLESPADASQSNGTDADSLSGIVLSQITASNFPPDAIIDGIRLTKTWADVPLAFGSVNDISVRAFTLAQNYPNPFNPLTTINFSLPATDNIDLSIYNLLGQKVATLVATRKAAGVHSVEWDASDFASGIYIYRLSTGNGYVSMKKLILLK